jgi:hypothetical protein
MLELIRSTWLEARDETTLVLCSPNIIMQWKKEAEKYAPDLPVTLLYGTHMRKALQLPEKPAGIVLSTPQTFFKNTSLIQSDALCRAVTAPLSYEREDWSRADAQATCYLFYPDFDKWCATRADRQLLAWNERPGADSMEERDPLEWLRQIDQRLERIVS